MMSWAGWGILGLLIPGVFALGGDWLLGQVFGDEYNQPVWRAVILSLAALVIWFIGCKLNRRLERTLVDVETGEKVTFKSKHTFFFVPMQYMALVWLAVGVFELFK